MLNHHVVIALRNLSRQKTLTFINVIGLSIGLACFSLFLLYAVNEFSYDRFHKNASQIYRVYEWTDGIQGAVPSGDAALYMPLGPAMKKDLPDVESFVRFDNGNEKFVKTGDHSLKMSVSFADPDIFQVFSFRLLHGTAAGALRDQRNVVLTREKALELFGETNIVGKTVDIKIADHFEPFVVSAVAENTPSNSSIQFSVLLSFEYLQTLPNEKNAVSDWHYSGYVNFVQLSKGSTLADQKEALSQFRDKYFPDEKAQYIKSGQWDGKAPYPVSFRLQPLRDIHSNLSISAGSQHGTDSAYAWILMGIATALLAIACINFTTLSIGRSAGRAKEVGLRKIIGSGRRRLVFQFLSEAVLLSALSGILSLGLVPILLPYFNQLSGKQLVFSFSQYPELGWLFAIVILLTGFLAGMYPAFVLSGFQPLAVIKNKIRLGGSNIFTKSLVTVQFVFSIGLVTSTIIILQQLNYMKSKNPGFNKENIIVVHAEETDQQKIFPLFKEQLTDYKGIAGISGADAPFGTGYNQSGFNYSGKHEQAFHFTADADFIKVMGMQLVAGRNFDPLHPADSADGAIVNEALVSDLSLTNEKVLGLKLNGYSRKGDPVVIGVVRNFNFLPLNQQISALLFRQSPHFIPLEFFVRIRPGDPGPAIERMKKTWASLVPDIPFHYSFLDDDLDQVYKTETRWSAIAGWAGGISILLSGLGLFGLAALVSVNRTKEIGIRKILGGSVTGIIGLLSKEFMKLVLLAFILACPLTFYFMNKWLQDYAYRTELDWWVFAITGLMVMLIAFMTVGYHAVRTAWVNPAKILRTE